MPLGNQSDAATQTVAPGLVLTIADVGDGTRGAAGAAGLVVATVGVGDAVDGSADGAGAQHSRVGSDKTEAEVMDLVAVGGNDAA